MRMSAKRFLKIAIFFAGGVTALLAVSVTAWAGSEFRGGGGAGGRGGAPHQPGHHGPWHHGPGYRRGFDAGLAAGAAAGDMAGGYNYPQPQSNPASMPNCTDELQQEQGAYYYRVGQRRFCY
jgi:hypothetical protein